MRTALPLFALLLQGVAQEPPPPEEAAPEGPPAGSLLLRDARLIEVAGASPREGVSILVVDGQIAAILEPGQEAEAERVVELGGATVIPGLIDSHVHVWLLQGEPFEELTSAERDRRLQRQLRAYVAAGVTTVVDACIYGDEAARIQGWLQEGASGPRMLTLAHSPVVPDSYLANVLPETSRIQESPEEVREYIRSEARYGHIGLKVALEDGVMKPIWAMPDEATLRAIREEAAAQGLPLFIHAMGAEETRLAVTLDPRVLLHSLREPDPVAIAAVAEAGVPVVATLNISDGFTLYLDPERLDDPTLRELAAPWDLEGLVNPELRSTSLVAVGQTSIPNMPAFLARWRFPQRVLMKKQREDNFAAASALYQAGVPMLMGSDAPAWPLMFSQIAGYSSIREMELLAEIGLSPEEVFAAATSRPAEVLELQDELGRIAVGRSADLVVLEADPLSTASAYRERRYVMRAGELRTPEEWLAGP